TVPDSVLGLPGMRECRDHRTQAPGAHRLPVLHGRSARRSQRRRVVDQVRPPLASCHEPDPAGLCAADRGSSPDTDRCRRTDAPLSAGGGDGTMTATNLAQATAPSAIRGQNDIVLCSMKVEEGTDPETLSRFGDDVWNLDPAIFHVTARNAF